MTFTSGWLSSRTSPLKPPLRPRRCPPSRTLSTTPQCGSSLLVTSTLRRLRLPPRSQASATASLMAPQLHPQMLLAMRRLQVRNKMALLWRGQLAVARRRLWRQPRRPTGALAALAASGLQTWAARSARRSTAWWRRVRSGMAMWPPGPTTRTLPYCRSVQPLGCTCCLGIVVRWRDTAGSSVWSGSGCLASCTYIHQYSVCRLMQVKVQPHSASC